MAESTGNNPKVSLEVGLDATPAVQGFQKVEDAGKRAAESLARSGKRAADAVAGIGDGGGDAAKKTDASTRSLIASIQRATAAAEAGGRGNAAYFKAIADQKGVSGTALKPYIDQLKEAEDRQRANIQALAAGTGALNAMGMSAKATAAAMRQVPAQFQDIVVSLQGGQAPMTVLLQQGSQLATSFGGAGNAARALGGYIAGLLSPVTLLAAAGVGVAYAFEKGADEQRAFQKSLILTGNAAGVTAGQLSDMAARIDKASGVTQGQAASALNVLVNAGIRGADALERFTASAVEFERAGGGAVDKVAENFAKLGKDPLKASLELNESMNYLTKSVYEQIKSLENQGRATEAARVAQEAYNSSLQDRTPQLLGNLGLIEKAWLKIKEATSGAANAALNIGREDTVGAQLDRLQATISANERDASRVFLGSAADQAKAVEAANAPLRQQQAALNRQLLLEANITSEKARQSEQVKAQVEFDRLREQSADRILQKEREKAKVKAAGEAAGAAPSDIKAALAAVDKRFEDKGAAAGAKRVVDAEIEALKSGLAVKEEIWKREADTRSSELKRGVLNQLQYIDLVKNAELEANTARGKILEEELTKSKKKSDSLKEQADLAGKIALNNEQALTIESKARNAVAEVMFKQAQAADAVYQAQKDEDEASRTALLVAEQAARERILGSIREYSTSIEESNKYAELEVAIMGQSSTARALAIEQFKIEAELRKRIREIDNSGLSASDKDIARAAATEAAAKAAAGAADKVLVSEFTKTADTISQTLTDALMRGFEGGKGFGKNLQDTFKNLSKTLILKPIIEMPVKQAAAALAPLQQKFTDFIATQILGQQQVAASAQASAVTSVAASQASGQAAAVAGVANQAGGDPYSAFFRMAAMAALMAGLGYVVNGGRGGGSAPVTNQGTGTVFGDPKAKSASIDNSIKLLADTSLLGLRYSAQMAASLKNIEAAMTGVTSLLLRTNGVGGLTGQIPTGNIGGGLLGAIDSVNRISSIATFGPVLGTFTKGLLDGLLGGIQTKLFGKKQTIQGSGILGGPQAFGDIEALGFQGNYYADVQTKSKFFGITTGTKNSTVLGKLDEQMARQFSLIFSGIGDSVKAAAGSLGLDLNKITDRLNGFVVDIGKIDLKGLSGKEIQEKLSNVFGAEADKIAEVVIPGFEEIVKVGEGPFETLIRVAHQAEVADLALGRLGLAIQKVGSSGDSMLDFALETLLGAPEVRRAVTIDKLIDQFGDVEAFTTATDDYYKAFYSQADQTRNTFDLLTTSLKGIGFELPTNAAAFRDLAKGLDLTTDEGQKAFQTLVTIGPAFAQMQEDILSAAGIGTDDIANTIRDGLLGRITQEDLGKQLSDTIIDGFYNALANGVSDQIASTFTNSIIAPMLQSIVTGGTLSSAVSQATIDGFINEAQTKIKAFSEILNSPAIKSALDQLQQSITGISGAMTGLTSSVKSLGDAATKTATATANAADIAYANDPSLRAYEASIQAAYKAKEAWEGVSKTIQDEINRLRNGDQAVRSLASLESSFAINTAQARAGDVDALGKLAGLSQQLDTARKAAAGSFEQYRLGQLQQAASLEQTIFGGATPFANTGTPTVYSTPQIAQVQSTSNSVLEQRLTTLIAKVEALQVPSEATATNTRRFADALKNAMPDGDAIATREAA